MAAEQKYTKEGFKKLQDEYDFLTQVRMEQIKVQIAEARSFGDLSENAEYDEAKNEQAQVEERIIKLESMIRRAVIIDESKIDSNVVTIGSIVKVNDMDFEEDFFEIGKECIMYFDKKGCIDDIVKISRLPEHKVVNVVNYLINDGKMNLLEFPLFEVEDSLVTIPSLILVNVK